MTTEGSSLRYPRENQSERITFYITPSFRERVNAAILDADMTQADWLRLALEEKVARFEGGTLEDQPTLPVLGSGSSEQLEIARLTSELAAARATIDGQERLITQQRERQGMSDALNQEQAKSLDTALDAVSRLSRALPAAGESTGGGGFNWRFWRR